MALRWTAVTESLQRQHPLNPPAFEPRTALASDWAQQKTSAWPFCPAGDSSLPWSSLWVYPEFLRAAPLSEAPLTQSSVLPPLLSQVETGAWPGDLCTLSITGAISSTSFALPPPLAHLLPRGSVTQERLQHLTDSRGPTASHGQVFSRSLGVHSCEIACFVFSYPLSFGSGEDGLGKQHWRNRAGEVTPTRERAPSAWSGCICSHSPPWNSYKIPLSVLDSRSGTILSHAHLTDEKAGARREAEGGEPGWNLAPDSQGSAPS